MSTIGNDTGVLQVHRLERPKEREGFGGVYVEIKCDKAIRRRVPTAVSNRPRRSTSNPASRWRAPFSAFYGCFKDKDNNCIARNIEIGRNGRPTSNATLNLSNVSIDSTLKIELKESRKLLPDHCVGRIDISIGEMVGASVKNPANCKFDSNAKEPCAIILSCRAPVPAAIAIEIAEHLVTVATGPEQVRNSLDAAAWALNKVLETANVTGGLHNLSMLGPFSRVPTALLKFISGHYCDDALVDMLDRMHRAFQIFTNAKDPTNGAYNPKHKIKELLEQAIECCRLVQQYVSHTFAERMTLRITSRKMNGFAERLETLTKELRFQLQSDAINKLAATDIIEYSEDCHIWWLGTESPLIVRSHEK